MNVTYNEWILVNSIRNKKESENEKKKSSNLINLTYCSLNWFVANT